MYVLNKAKIIECKVTTPLQIEEITDAPNILLTLYGVKNNKSVTKQEVHRYKNAVRQLESDFRCVSKKTRESLIEEALDFYLKNGGYKR